MFGFQGPQFPLLKFGLYLDAQGLQFPKGIGHGLLDFPLPFTAVFRLVQCGRYWYHRGEAFDVFFEFSLLLLFPGQGGRPVSGFLFQQRGSGLLFFQFLTFLLKGFPFRFKPFVVTGQFDVGGPAPLCSPLEAEMFPDLLKEISMRLSELVSAAYKLS
jgi:hypothetical protein